jgi:hypothetical protein
MPVCYLAAWSTDRDARPSIDQNAADQEQQQTPFNDQATFNDTFKTAQDSLNDEDEEDAVPDVSPLACSTLRQHLSVQPETFDMEWQEMGCSYTIHGATKVVLQGIWGRARPGEMQVRHGCSQGARSVAGNGKTLQR